MFEDRGPYCSLLVFVDDATGRLMEMRFVRTESAFGYFDATTSYLRRHGKPVAFYSDKHTEDDARLTDLLKAVGAEVRHEILHLAGDLPTG